MKPLPRASAEPPKAQLEDTSDIAEAQAIESQKSDPVPEQEGVQSPRDAAAGEQVATSAVAATAPEPQPTLSAEAEGGGAQANDPPSAGIPDTVLATDIPSDGVGLTRSETDIPSDAVGLTRSENARQ